MGGDMKLEDIIEIIERDLPNWNWLIRSDENTGAFANITTPHFVSAVQDTPNGFIDVSVGRHFGRYAADPMTALSLSYEAAMADENK